MIFTLIARCRIRRPHRVHFALPTYFLKGYIMTDTLTLQNDAQAVVKLVATDGIGAPIAVPAGGTVTASDSTLFSAVLNADNSVTVVAVPGASGNGTLNWADGSLGAVADVIITIPAVKSVAFDVADAVITAQVAPVVSSASTATAAAA